MNKKLRLSSKYYALFTGVLLHLTTLSQVYCTGDTPFFSVDLTGNPGGTWVSPSVVRDGSCCGGGADQVNCIEMSITLDPSAVGINFSVVSGANPGGALYYQINCQNVPMPTSGEPICLEGVGPHYISYCKVGNNQNEYAITSVPGPYTSGDILTAEGCSELLSVTGVDPSSITWNSISPGTPGQYNDFLSNTAGTSTGTSGTPFPGFSDVNVTPTPGAPTTVQYEVCGNVVASCLTEPFCDTVTVTIVPELDVAISPATPYICYGQTFVTLTANPVGGLAPYTYSWSTGQTTSSINVTSGGTYSVTITDATGCPVATDQVTVVEFVQPITAAAGPDLTVCAATSANVSVGGSVTGVTTGIWSGGTGTYSIDNTDLSLDYTLSASEIASGSVTLTLTTTNNGTCPPASDQMTITVSEMTATVASIQHLSCFGGSNGSAIIDATGGVLPYTYSLNGGPGQASNSFTGLPAGSYTVEVTDAAGCSGITNFTITTPPQLSFTTISQDVSCFGVCDGEISVTASGGTAPYTYSSNGGTTFSSSPLLSGLCAGTIGVVVQDDNGCLTNVNVIITQPTQLTASYGLTDPVCFGSCDGEISVSAAGGTPVYQYSVDGGALQGSANLTGLCAGNHTIVVQDANGCEISTVQALVDPPTFGIDMISMTPSNCGFNNGSIEIAANGANGPFTYSMDGGPAQASGVFSNLVAGAYSFVATDALGCQAQVFLGVNDVEMDGILIDQGDVTCYGGNDGWVEVVNQAGFAPITYELDNSGITQTNGVFNGLMAGSHIVTIYDAGFCVFTIPFTVTQPDEILFTTNATNVTCSGGTDGQISFTNTTGGTGAYQYSIDGFTFQSGATFSGLTAGTYFVYVMDANNCIVTGEVTITEPTPVTFDFNATDLSCFENSTGVILLSGAGGQGSYQYSIDGGVSFQSGPAFFGLEAGTYPIVVEDVAGCPVTGSVVLTQPPVLTASYTSQPVTCFGSCDGEVTVVANGGTAPYVYSADNGTTVVVTPTISGLCAGSYPIQVVDDNGCGILSTVSISSPTQVSASMATTPSTCGLPNGSVTTGATGGTPGYSYSIDNVNFSTNPVFNGLAAGAYTVYVQDNQGCPVSVNGIVSGEPSPVITNVVSTDVTCNAGCDGTLTISASGGTGTVQYSIGGAYQLSGSFSGLCAGMYNLSITDDNGCITDYGAPFEITEPTPLQFTTTQTDLTCFDNGTGVINFQASGATPAYAYSIDNGSSYSPTPYAQLLDAGTYDLIVMDANGCSTSGQVTLTQPPLLEIVDLVPTDALCFEACDGEAEVFVQGGTTVSDYTYNWYTVAASPNSAQIGGLCAGTYTSVVLDDNGCYDTINFVINEPLAMIIDSLDASNPLCNGSCDGSITLWSSDAVSYSFDGGVTFGADNTNDTLCEGSYNVVVQSANGCLASIDQVVITDPPLLTVVAGPDSVICLGSQAYLTANATGGTQPYTYYWDQDSGPHTIVVVPVSDSTYSVYVEDANGCISNIDSASLSLYQELQTSVTNDTIICPGNPVNLSVTVQSGVPSYTYAWHENGNPFSDFSQTTANPASASTYIVYTSDLCTTVTDTVQVNVHDVPVVTPLAEVTEACAPMTAVVFPGIDPSLLSGNCTWTFSDGTVLNGCDTVTHVFTDPGCYAVTFAGVSTDGCPVDGFANDVFCVIPNPEAAFYHNPISPTYLNAEIDFYNQSGYADTYAWTFSGHPGSNLENPTVDVYGAEVGDTIWACLIASNYLGCFDELCQPIVIEDEFALYVPNAFTPDGDQNNQFFRPVFPIDYDIKNYQLLVFNRWGEVVFESLDPAIGWNGKYAERPSQDGTYTWKIRVTDGRTNRHHELVGHVSLLK